MTLLEMKNDILRMIEEVGVNSLTDDEDIENKLNSVINQVMFELARIKKIPAFIAKTIEKDDYIFDLRSIENFYQLFGARFTGIDGNEKEIDIFETILEVPCEGTLKIRYYKYPERITDDTTDSAYVFELAEDALEVMPYGVAADLLKSDVSNNYGKVYAERYESMKQMLDPRYNVGMIYIEEA